MHAKVRRESVAGYATDETLVCGPKEHTRWWQRCRGHLQGLLYRLILNSYLHLYYNIGDNSLLRQAVKAIRAISPVAALPVPCPRLCPGAGAAPRRGPWPASAAVARARFAPGPQPVAGLCRHLSQNSGGRPAATPPLVAVGGPAGHPNLRCRYISCLKFPFRPYCFIILRDGHVFTIQPLLLRSSSRVVKELMAYNALYGSIIR